jgi:hypothetical protein
MLDDMDIDGKVNYLRIAFGMSGLGVSLTTTEIIFRTFQALEKMGGEFSLMDAAKIEVEVEKKYAEKYQASITINQLEDAYKEVQSSKDPEKILESIKSLIDTIKSGNV